MRKRCFWLLLVLMPGCSDGWREELESKFSLKKPAPPEPKPASQPARDPLLAETIGAVAALGDADGQRVRGFSLVIGLGENGSSDCPSAIREYLVDYLTKQVGPQGSLANRGGPTFNAGKLIDSPDTAVVEVSGIIPPGAPKNAVFDLRVEALPGTQTRSLDGGLLLPCELRIWNVGASGQALLEGRAVARAGGPVFLNPFASPGDALASGDPKRGFVLGGGVALAERPLKLILVEPSYATARRIEQRLNERFGHSPKAAEAISKGFVELHTPPAFTARTERFMQLATYVMLEPAPGIAEQRMRELAEQFSRPGAPYERIALLVEGVGKSAIPHLAPLYANADPSVSFFAARSGLRLKDSAALPIVAQIAAAARHPHRLAAVRELGDCDLAQATQRLLPLVDAEDQDVRIAAYEGLARHRYGGIRSRRFPSTLDPDQLNVAVDILESTGKPLIYVSRSREPRIAVFGSRVPVVTPVFLSPSDDLVTISANAPRSDLTVYSRKRYGVPLNERLVVPARVPELIAALADRPKKDDNGKLRGVGLTYSQVVNVLDRLCRDEAINARLVLQQVTLTELLGPAGLPERPEADDLPPPDEQPEGEPPPTPHPADELEIKTP